MANGLFGGGDGSVNDPYLIEDAADLNAVRNNLTASYKLVNNIDLSGMNWVPIGLDGEHFSGTLDGNGNTIKNLNINTNINYYVGIFRNIERALIKNLTIENPNIVTAGMYVGALVGFLWDSTVMNVHVKFGTVMGGNCTGGVIGYADESTIAKVSSTSNVTGEEDVGGLIGKVVNYTNIEDVFATCTTTGNINVGGLIGSLGISASVKNAYAAGSVIGEDDVGGVIGYLQFKMVNIFSLVTSVSGTGNNIGKFYGKTDRYSTMKNIYALNDIEGNGHEDGINTFITPEQALDISTYESAGWDILNTWVFVEGQTYPSLIDLPNKRIKIVLDVNFELTIKEKLSSYLSKFAIGNIDFLSINDDVTELFKSVLRGGLMSIIPSTTYYADIESLTGIDVKLKDSYESFNLTLFNIQGDTSNVFVYFLPDNRLSSVKVPKVNNDTFLLVVSERPYSEYFSDESLFDTTFFKVFGVNFSIEKPPLKFDFIIKSTLNVKAEITWNTQNGDVIYIVDPATLDRILPIQNIINPLISEQINAHYTFTFDTVYDDKTKYINSGSIIEVDGDYFQVSRIVKKRSTTISMSVSCEHVSYVLLDNKKFPMSFTEMEDDPFEIMRSLLENTPFSVDTVEFFDYYHVNFKSDNIRGALIELANLVGGELVWDKITVSLVAKRGQNKGLEFRLGENLIGVTEEIDTTGDEPRHALEVDVLDLARVPGYEYLKTVELGDTVRVFDPELDINETLRIVSRDYNPFQKINPRVSIGNIIRDFTGYVKDELVDSSSKDKSDGLVKYGRVIDYKRNWDEIGMDVMFCQLDDGKWYKCLTSLEPPYGGDMTGLYVMVVDGVVIGYFDIIEIG
jgi:hypothetical protein